MAVPQTMIEHEQLIREVRKLAQNELAKIPLIFGCGYLNCNECPMNLSTTPEILCLNILKVVR